MRNLSPIIYASVVGLLLACSDSTAPSEDPTIVQPPGGPPAAALQISPATVTLHPGQTFRFSTRYGGDPALMGTPGHVAWQSSDNNVVTVTGGVVSALSAGEARITAFWQGYQASALVTVVGPAKKHEDAIACIKRLPNTKQRLMAQC
jgi:Bacterial Ig-like domain (group 2)